MKSIPEEFPNALAQLRIYPKKHEIKLVNVFTQKTVAQSELDNDNKKKPAKPKKLEASSVDSIWKNMGNGKIDISYACIGYSMDGRPILNHNDLLDMLVKYGYRYEDAVGFIEDYTSMDQPPGSPIIMAGVNAAKIAVDIVPIAKPVTDK